MNAEPASADAVLAGFRGRIEPVHVSAGYLVTLALVAAAMLLLPLLYVAQVGLFFAAFLWWARHGYELVGGFDAGMYAFFAYLAVLLTGALFVFLLVKPLFAPPAPRHRPRRLEADREPVLFAFIGGVAEALGAPKPRRVQVDLQVNASAGFRRGFLSLFSDDLVLTLGLPMVAGLSVEQLAGILAHELGHFAQRTAARLNHTVRAIDDGLARVVYQRDAWDLRLERSRHEESFPALAVVFFLQGTIWLARRFLWLLLMAGHAISCLMSRQMEHDADRYQARLVGADAFIATQRSMMSLAAAQQHALADLRDMWRERRLGDNLPRLVAGHPVRDDPALARSIEHRLSQAEGTWFDRHPTAAARLARVRREEPAPRFANALPASALFSDFDHLARLESRAYYEAVLGARVAPGSLVTVGEVEAGQARAAEEAERVAGFLATFHPLRPLPLPDQLPAEPAGRPPAELRAALAAEAAAAASRIATHRAGAGEALDGWVTAWERRLQVEEATELLRVDVPFEAADYGLPSASAHGIELSRRRADGTLRRLGRQLTAGDQEGARRLVAGLRLARLAGDGDEREAAGLLACAGHLYLLRTLLAELTDLDRRCTVLADHYHEAAEQVRGVVVMRHDTYHLRLSRLLAGVHRSLTVVPHRLAPGEREMTVADYTLPNGPPPEDRPEEVHPAVVHLHRGLLGLYPRVIGRLCTLAAAAERRAAAG